MNNIEQIKDLLKEVIKLSDALDEKIGSQADGDWCKILRIEYNKTTGLLRFIYDDGEG